MAKITPILIVLAIGLSFVFTWAAPVMIGIWCLFFLYWINFLGKIIGRRRWYQIPKGWNYSTISLLDMLFFWNRLIFRKGLTMKFYINSGMLEYDEDDRFNKLGGIRTGLWRDNSIRVGFRAVDVNTYVAAMYYHENGKLRIGPEHVFSYSDNRKLSLYMLREKSKYGVQQLSYWLYDDEGNELDYHVVDNPYKIWSILLPYWENMSKRISVEVEVF